MSSSLAFAMGEVSRGCPLKVFDWHKAARLIRERNPAYADAGLAEDRAHTGGTIYRGGEVADDYTYLASTWATPAIWLDGDEVPCWAWEGDTPGWDENTHWPETALAILAGQDAA